MNFTLSMLSLFSGELCKEASSKYSQKAKEKHGMHSVFAFTSFSIFFLNKNRTT